MIEFGRLVLLLCFPVIQTSPLKIMEIHPISIRAPISQIHWNYHNNWNNHVMSDFEIPRSYQTQNMNTNIQDDKTSSNIQFSVDHPKYFPRPKSLHISLEPTLAGSVSKLQVKDTFLDAIQQFTTAAPKQPTTTTRPKKRPTVKRPHKPHKATSKASVDENEVQQTVIAPPSSTPVPLQRPGNNNLAGQSQIGNRESQMVIKPTVIVNFRGTVTNTDSDIAVESRANDDEYANENNTSSAQNVFNINQEVRIENTYSMDDQYSDVPETSDSTIEINFDDSTKKSKSLPLPTEGAEPLGTVLENNLPEKRYVFNIGPLGGFLRFY